MNRQQKYTFSDLNFELTKIAHILCEENVPYLIARQALSDSILSDDELDCIYADTKHKSIDENSFPNEIRINILIKKGTKETELQKEWLIQ